MKNLKLTTKIAIIISIIVLIVVIFDYFNIPSKIGLRIDNFNFDVLLILSSAITTIGIYLCTYFLIERNRLDRQNNQLLIAKDLLSRVYDECERIVKHLDGNRVKVYLESLTADSDKERTIQSYITYPFINDKHITKFGEDGVLPYFFIQRYFRVKNNYILYIDWLFQNQKTEETIAKMKERLYIQIQKAREEFNTNKQAYYSDEEKPLFEYNEDEDTTSEERV